ncbi:MAG: pilus (MSHA type) biogenesis protein MshL [Pseudomonadota bacterium]
MSCAHPFKTTLLISAITCNACTTLPTTTGTPQRNAIQDALSEAASQAVVGPGAELPPDVGRALLPSLRFHIPLEEIPEEPRFDLNANNIAAKDLFLNLMSTSPYNIVVHPSVTGKISIHLKNVTIEDALQALREVYGYEYLRTGNRYTILGNSVTSRIYPVNYLDFKRKGASSVQIAANGLRSSGGSSSATSSGATSGGSNGSASAISLDTTSETNFWKDLETALVALIGKEDNHQAVVNPAAGLVVVRASPRELRVVEEFLGLTQSTMNRQVIIEAKIFEVELDDTIQTGINWTAMAKGVRLSQTGGGTAVSSGASENYGVTGDMAGAAIANSRTSSFGGIFSLAFGTGGLGAFLEFLQTQGRIHILSSPRVATLNNQKAVIKVGDDNFYITKVTSQTTSTTAGTSSSPTVELSPFFSGVALDVTPQIDNNDNILLHIHPAISDVAQISKVFTIGGQSYDLPVASSNIQESDNVVRARSGQMVVIGGMMKESEVERRASIPILGNIPFIGELFTQRRLVKIKKELVILLKPTIIDYDGEQWRKTIEKTADNAYQIDARTE